MKNLKSLLFSGIVTLGVFSMIGYTSCKKDACKDVVCKNGGTCADGSCKCPTGYEGASCETKMTAKFVGTFNATDQCPIGNRTGNQLKYGVTSFADNLDPLKVSFVGIANTPSSNILTATVDDQNKNQLNILDQVIAGKTYSGTVTYVASGQLNLVFQIKEDGDAVEACTSVLIK